MYKTIIFDLDDTLTDDYENTKEAFKLTMQEIKQEYTEQNFIKFHTIDKQTWKRRAEGKIITPYEDNKEKKAEWLRAHRFLEYFNNKISYEEAVSANEIYMNKMKEKVVCREGALEIIKYLYEKGYQLLIATNGPVIPLKTKIEKIGIQDYITTIFSAEEVGFMKPHKKFYDGLFEKAKIEEKEQVLFIGDELEKDIKGGIEYGIDTCWYRWKEENEILWKPKYEINQLSDLKKIL